MKLAACHRTRSPFLGERPGGGPFNAKDHYTSQYIDVTTSRSTLRSWLDLWAFYVGELCRDTRRIAEKDTLEVTGST